MLALVPQCKGALARAPREIQQQRQSAATSFLHVCPHLVNASVSIQTIECQAREEEAHTHTHTRHLLNFDALTHTRALAQKKGIKSKEGLVYSSTGGGAKRRLAQTTRARGTAYERAKGHAHTHTHARSHARTLWAGWWSACRSSTRPPARNLCP